MTEKEDNCNICSYNWPSNGNVPYCTKDHFPILNPNIGCSKWMKSYRRIRKDSKNGNGNT